MAQKIIPIYLVKQAIKIHMNNFPRGRVNKDIFAVTIPQSENETND